MKRRKYTYDWPRPGLTVDIALFTVATVVWTLGEVLWAPMSATFIAVRAPEGRVSTYQGSYFFAWNAAFVVGSPAGLALAHAHGYGALWLSVLGLGCAVTLGFALSSLSRPTSAPRGALASSQ